MTCQFQDLPYDFAALEPHIDKMTMEIHYGKHHRTYFDKMKQALAGTEAETMSIERILANVAKLGAQVRNNAGGYYNHNIFWRSLSPDGGGDPAGSLAGEVERTFGGADNLRKEIAAAAIGRFGSGFAWLIVQKRKLKVVSTPNQDNPMMNVAEEIRARDSDSRPRCLGARLLFEAPKPPPGICRGVLESRRLETNARPLRGGDGVGISRSLPPRR